MVANIFFLAILITKEKQQKFRGINGSNKSSEEFPEDFPVRAPSELLLVPKVTKFQRNSESDISLDGEVSPGPGISHLTH
jgi:hypothetical protein